MRELNPVYVPMMNTTTWYLDGDHVRVVQPLTGRDIILPRRYSQVWAAIEQGADVAGVIAQAAQGEPPLAEDEVRQTLVGLEALNLIKLTHPCWMEAPEETT